MGKAAKISEKRMNEMIISLFQDVPMSAPGWWPLRTRVPFMGGRKQGLLSIKPDGTKIWVLSGDETARRRRGCN